jgi:thiamine biosynthesis lipoprotein
MIHQAANTEFITVQGAYFDTINTISAWCSHSTLTEAMAQCEKYDSLLSKTVTGSDVWKLNHAKGEAITVSNDTIEILKVAQAVNNASDGAFI